MSYGLDISICDVLEDGLKRRKQQRRGAERRKGT
jgi:hypothetical protein